jgi:hypothetical protein
MPLVNCWAGRKVGSIVLFLRKMQGKGLVGLKAGCADPTDKQGFELLKWTCSPPELLPSDTNLGIAALKSPALRKI